MNTTSLAVGTAMHLVASETATASGAEMMVLLGIVVFLIFLGTWR